MTETSSSCLLGNYTLILQLMIKNNDESETRPPRQILLPGFTLVVLMALAFISVFGCDVPGLNPRPERSRLDVGDEAKYENRGGSRKSNSNSGAGSGRRSPQDRSHTTQKSRSGTTYRDRNGTTYRDRSGTTYRGRSGTTYRDRSGTTYRDRSGTTYRDRSGTTYRDRSGTTSRFR